MSTTLNAGRKINVTLEAAGDATEPNVVEVTVRQIRICDYDQGLKCFLNEIELVAFLIGKDKSWVTGTATTPGITPESFENILAVGREVNERGFFASCRRRIEAEEQARMRMEAFKETQRELEIIAGISKLPADLQARILTEGAKAMASLNGSDTSSPPPPRPR